MPSRPRHPNKHIEAALKYAESCAWTVVKRSGGHTWGRMYCHHSERGGCIESIWSTPKVPEKARPLFASTGRQLPALKPSDTNGKQIVEHEFTLILSGFDQLTDEIEDAVVKGCPDALGLGIRNCVPHIAFLVDDDSLLDAVTAAIRQVENLGIGTVQRVEPDELVGLSDIGRRIGMTREAVRLCANGERGPGGFPQPIATPSRNARVWKWHDVVAWFTEHGLADVDPVMTGDAATIAIMNAALELRRHIGSQKALMELWRDLQTPAVKA